MTSIGARVNSASARHCVDTEAAREDAASLTAGQTEHAYLQAVQDAARRAIFGAAQGAAGGDARGSGASSTGDGEVAGDQGQKGGGDEVLKPYSEAKLRARLERQEAAFKADADEQCRLAAAVTQAIAARP